MDIESFLGVGSSSGSLELGDLLGNLGSVGGLLGSLFSEFGVFSDGFEDFGVEFFN